MRQLRARLRLRRGGESRRGHRVDGPVLLEFDSRPLDVIESVQAPNRAALRWGQPEDGNRVRMYSTALSGDSLIVPC